MDIAKEAGLSRVATYVIIDALKVKGLLREEHVGKKRKVAAQSPMKLWETLEERHNKLKRQEQKLEDIIPQLRLLIGAPQRGTNITCFE